MNGGAPQSPIFRTACHCRSRIWFRIVMADSVVVAIKRDHLAFMPMPGAAAAAHYFAVAFEHDNEADPVAP